MRLETRLRRILPAAVVCAAGLVPSAAARPVGFQSRFPRLDSYLASYRQGKILYLDTGGGRQGGTILDSLGPGGRLAKALEEAVASDTPEAAARLLALASIVFEEDPELERERYAARQPWAVRAKAAAALGKLRRPESLEFLAREVLLARSAYRPSARAAAARAVGEAGFEGAFLGLRAALLDPESEVRVAAASALGAIGSPEARSALLGRLRDEDPVVRARMVEALGKGIGEGGERKGGEAAPIVRAVCASLSDRDWRVRAAAADFLVEHPSEDAVGALIEAMSAERERCRSGEGRKRIVFSIVRALTRLAGATVSLDDPGRWQQWWEAHRASFRVAPAVTASVGASGSEPTYFGIPVRTDRVVFVLDVSGSMGEPADSEAVEGPRGAPRRRRRAAPSEAPRLGPTKLDRAKEELLAILDRLGPEDRLNLVLFSGTVERLFDTVVPATATNRATAAARVRSAAAAGGTNLFGALEASLRIRGVLVDRFYTDADTVFLLSDGVPTSGAVVDPDTIAAAVGAANLGSRIALHGIFLGPDGSPGAEFMKRIARENYGEFRRVRP